MPTRTHGTGAPPDADDQPAERDEAEGFEGYVYVTGELPYQTQDEILLDQERTEPRSEDDRDHEAPEEVIADPIALDERDDVNTVDDVDRQGRRGQEEHDWQGSMYADSGRNRPDDGTRRRRR